MAVQVLYCNEGKRIKGGRIYNTRLRGEIVKNTEILHLINTRVFVAFVHVPFYLQCFFFVNFNNNLQTKFLLQWNGKWEKESCVPLFNCLMDVTCS